MGMPPLPEPLREALSRFVALMTKAQREGVRVSVVAGRALELGVL
jgi:hypothetical protein